MFSNFLIINNHQPIGSKSSQSIESLYSALDKFKSNFLDKPNKYTFLDKSKYTFLGKSKYTFYTFTNRLQKIHQKMY